MDYEQITTHYINLAAQLLDEALGENRQQWIEQMTEELPQIRQVLAWLEEQENGRQGLQLVYLLQELWFEENYMEEGLTLIQRFLQFPENLALSMARAKSLDLAGAFASGLGNLTLARSLKEEAIAIFRQLGNQGELGYALLHNGHLVGLAQGDFLEAKATYREALDILKALDDEAGSAHATANLARVMLELGDTSTAQTLVHDGLKRYTELNLEWDLALTLGIAAGIAAAQGDFDRALQLAGASATHRERIGISQMPADQAWFNRVEREARSGLPPREADKIWKEGKTMTLAAAVAFAL